MTRRRRPSRKARARERREASRHGMSVEQLRRQSDPNTGRGRKRREQGGG